MAVVALAKILPAGLFHMGHLQISKFLLSSEIHLTLDFSTEAAKEMTSSFK